MTRHARNNTASACYTYHERQRDTANSGYGTIRERLAKDSIGDFDACCLTLQPCRNPVVTPNGYLFDKEAILEYIIHKKAENARKLKQYEKERKRQEMEMAELADAEEQTKAEKFINMERGLINPNKSNPKRDLNQPGTSEEKSVSNMAAGLEKKLPSFWIPSLTPKDEGKESVKPPDTTITCPMSGKPLKAKDLIPVKFIPVDPNLTREQLITKQERYLCPVTRDVLGNSVPCAVLRTSGSVVTMDCIVKIIRKDMIDPTNGKPLKDKDIIPLQRGGTGYSSTNNLESKIQKPVMQA
ncbi:nitric oxide synthase-interacting protein homolog isoform X1 [Panonychus citri]|uniref:nitric oxide synthase-interacting protein homolog isoform X1 n=1 Tax=Panonychus citri TaxID=50023 RepID=UPI0023070359|nr:nitric oxide synthase-interacting protein homolog isoform X1 [Panonychus citri]